MPEPVHADDLGLVPLDGDPFCRVPAGYSAEARLEARRIEANRQALRSAYQQPALVEPSLPAEHTLGVWPR